MPHKDPEINKAYRRQWYANNREKEQKRLKKYKTDRIEFIQNYKVEHGCAHCGDKRLPVLQFHHLNGRNGDKERCISSMAWRVSMEKLLKALDECVVLCANCHAIEHWIECTPVA